MRVTTMRDDEMWLVKWSWREEYKVMLMRRKYNNVLEDYKETQQDLEGRARGMIGYQGGTLEVIPLDWGMSHGSGKNQRRDGDMVQLDI